MNSIMHGSIHDIAEQKAGEEGKSIDPHQRLQTQENKTGNDEAGNRWHKQPFPVSWILMMDAMERIDKLLGSLTVCDEMK